MPEPLSPGSTIGILGGGQLGRMMAMEAARLGFQVHIFCPEQSCPAAEVSAFHTVAEYTDMQAIERFCAAVDVVTLEFENIPLAGAYQVERFAPLHPSSHVLEICQHRVKEKEFVQSCGIATAPFAPARSLAEAKASVERIGTPCILKTCTMGYDGKGQQKITHMDEVAAAWNALGSEDIIVEGYVAFEKEASVIVTRAGSGEMRIYPLVENIHQNHILHQTIAPANLPDPVMQQACHIARSLAERLQLQGILAVELFVCANGELMVNELAPRPHNSGHWSMDACLVSQFEQTIRAVTGLPLLDIGQHSRAVMTNLIGEDVSRWQELAAMPQHCLHLYGKKEIKAGRKMGHVTKVMPL